ncbi:hypothetical protein Vretifemale_16008, partial [Volvox reticuliferus]
RESVGPGALVSSGMPCAEAVVSGLSSELLDLVLPSVVDQAGIVTAARVPIEYITMGDEAWMKWLSAHQKEGRMVLCRSSGCLWVVIFATVFWRDALFRESGDTVEVLKVYISPVRTTSARHTRHGAGGASDGTALVVFDLRYFGVTRK